MNTSQIAADRNMVPSELPVYTPEGHLEIIPGRLYWATLNSAPRSSTNYHYFSIDQELVYEPFFADFGPLNLSSTFRYCKLVKALLDDKQLSSRRICHFCSQDPKKKANAAFLICAFQVMMLRLPSEIAYRPFGKERFVAFRDATCGICNYQCTVLDCIQGLDYAIKIKWFNPDTFNVQAYEFYERVENGDMNWVIPDKFLAFAGPSATSVDPDGYHAFTPEDYIPVFKNGGVQMVVRLNKKQYDRRRFIDAGIKHLDLYFLDGSCPSSEIINKFLYVAETEPGAIAIHCKAGLGRTGTLIGLYAQKHFNFPGRAYIGWNRICRPGAILGPQQQFLVDMQQSMWQQGQIERAKLTNQPHHNIEDVGQGERLTNAKRNVQQATNAVTTMKAGRGRISSAKPLSGMFGPQPVNPVTTAVR